MMRAHCMNIDMSFLRIKGGNVTSYLLKYCSPLHWTPEVNITCTLFATTRSHDRGGGKVDMQMSA